MELLSILFKINVSLLIFYLVYRLALRKLTFYNFNRMYLLASIIIAAAIPFVPYYKSAQTSIGKWQSATGINPSMIQNYVSESKNINWTAIATYTYWAGVLTMGFLFWIQLCSLLALYFRSKKTNVLGYEIRTTKETLHPFSFFKSIFVNPQEHSFEALQSILQHENVHARQWHSFDVMVGEIKRIFCWFNPAAWLMLAAIRENLEFIADRNVLKNGTDKKAYQFTLLAAQQAATNNSLTNNFNFSHLKLRITMMNKTKSSDVHLLKYLLAVPVVACALLLTNFAQAQEQKVRANQEDNADAKPSGIETVDNTKKPTSDTASRIITNWKSRADDNLSNSQMLKDLESADIFTSTMKYVDGEPIKYEYKNLKSFKITTNSSDGLDLKFTDDNSSLIIESNDNNAIAAAAGGLQKKDVVVYLNDKLYTKPLNSIDPKSIVTMNIYKGSATKDFHKAKHPGKAIIDIRTNAAELVNPIVYLLNGKRINNPKEVDQSEVVQMNETIGKAVQEKYPNFPAGSKVVEFITNDYVQEQEITEKKSPVIYVNGKIFDKGINAVDPVNIDSMIVLKDKIVQAKYPNLPAGSSVIEIITKDYHSTKSTQNNTKAIHKLNIFPNPTSNKWKIDYPDAGANDSYELFDQQGRKRASGKLFKTNEIDASKLETGVYFFKAKLATGNSDLRLEVVK